MSIFFVLFCHLYSSWSCAGLSSKSLLVSDRFFPPPSMVTSSPFQEETSLFLAFCNCSDIVCYFAYFVAQVGLFPFANCVASGLLISKRNRLKRRNIERMAFFFDDQLHEIDLVSWLADVRTPFRILIPAVPQCCYVTRYVVTVQRPSFCTLQDRRCRHRRRKSPILQFPNGLMHYVCVIRLLSFLL